MLGSSFQAIKRNKSDYTYKTQFKCDQFVHHKDKGDLILQFLFFEQSQLQNLYMIEIACFYGNQGTTWIFMSMPLQKKHGIAHFPHHQNIFYSSFFSDE